MTRRYLLDTGPAFDFLFKRRGVEVRVANAKQAGAKVGICVPVLGEIVGGLEASASRDASWAVARRSLGQLVCWPYDRDAAYEYGRIYADLKRRGRIIQQIDMQIAAVALSLTQCVVVSSDTDLTAVSGLTVENWAS